MQVLKRTSQIEWMIQKVRLELSRRFRLFSGKSDAKWPEVPAGVFLNPSDGDFAEYENSKLELTWSKAAKGNSLAWQAIARGKLFELLGIDLSRDSSSALITTISAVTVTPTHSRQTFYLLVAPRRHVPITIVWDPKKSKESLPAMICLQGHNSGAHISWGEVRLPVDAIRIKNGGDFAIQAVNHGHVAICVEQLGFGERREQAISHRWDHPCVDACNRALLLGRTVLGKRIIDIKAIIDWLQSQTSVVPAINEKKIRVMGNSAGGETALFAMALDARIEAAIVSGCVGAWRKTSGTRLTCPDTVIPGVLNWFEYSDILAMCAPRPLVVVSGIKDHLYPYHFAEECVRVARSTYSELNVPSSLVAVQGPSGHQFYPDIAWTTFLNLIKRTAPSRWQ